MEMHEKTRIAEDTQKRLEELTKSLKGWNLITGLYCDRNSHEDDVVHALALEAREIVLKSITNTFELGVAALKDQDSTFQALLRVLADLDDREAKLAALCRTAMTGIKHATEKEAA